MWNNKELSVLGIQLACVGLTLVAGFFFLWRMMSRVEDKMTRFMEEMRNAQSRAATSQANACFGGMDPTETLKALFGDDGESEGENDDDLMMFSQLNVGEMPKVEIVEEEAEAEAETKESVPEAAAPPLSTTSGRLPSKSKLSRMNGDELRQLAELQGLSKEGTKAELMERLVAAS